MSRFASVMFAALAVVALLAVWTVTASTFANADGKPQAQAQAKAKTVLNFEVKDIDNKTVKLSDYSGQVLLIVNTASKCGYTPQYEALESVYLKYQEQGFKVLAFPCNDFGAQEPGTEAEIKEFCKSNYHASFPLFAKVTVKGASKHPLYSFLTSKETNPKQGGDIRWNFTKFLVGRDGQIIERFEPGVKPDDMKVLQSIEQALKAPKS